MQRKFGSFLQLKTKQNRKVSFGVFSEGLMINIGKIRDQYDLYKAKQLQYLFYPQPLG
jgi:hypothetical protein